MTRPLWQTLLSLVSKNRNTKLTCDECFELLEYLVEIAGQNAPPVTDADRQYLQTVAVTHFQQCPHCQQHHLELLRQMETQLHYAETDDD